MHAGPGQLQANMKHCIQWQSTPDEGVSSGQMRSSRTGGRQAGIQHSVHRAVSSTQAQCRQPGRAELTSTSASARCQPALHASLQPEPTAWGVQLEQLGAGLYRGRDKAIHTVLARQN